MPGLDQLDQFQRAAATCSAKRLAIEAPAGSGKTRVLIERVAWFVAAGVPQERVLVLTFARKAAREVRERLIARGLDGVIVKTFHAWALELVRRSHVVAGRLVLEQEKQALLWKIGCKMLLSPLHRQRVGDVCDQNNWSQPFLLRQLMMIQTSLTQSGVGPAHAAFCAMAHQDPLAALAKSLMQNYQAVLARHGASDFALLIESALVSTAPAATRFTHVLVDEVQDAAHNELALIKKYCYGAVSQTWVGDPNQSLYGWRGSAGVVPEAEQTCVLRYNYRSSTNVISVVNHFLQHRVPGSSAIQAHRPAAIDPEIVTYPRYGEDRLCLRLIAELLQKKFEQRDIVIIARAHLPLDQLQKTRATYPHVRAVTVHAFKGLEARAVLILNVAKNRFGFPAASKGEAHMLLQRLSSYDRAREECNIFYVAMTRARDRLIVCVPHGEESPFTQVYGGRFRKRLVRHVTLPGTYS